MMTTCKIKIRPVALLIALVYFFLSGFMMVGTGEHDFKHEHNADHAKQHSSLACDWMCTAAAFVHSADPTFTHSLNFSFESKVVNVEHFFTSLSIFSLNIRPPPLSLS